MRPRTEGSGGYSRESSNGNGLSNRDGRWGYHLRWRRRKQWEARFIYGWPGVCVQGVGAVWVWLRLWDGVWEERSCSYSLVQSWYTETRAYGRVIFTEPTVSNAMGVRGTT
jgi:hypothetical protein